MRFAVRTCFLFLFLHSFFPSAEHAAASGQKRESPCFKEKSDCDVKKKKKGGGESGAFGGTSVHTRFFFLSLCKAVHVYTDDTSCALCASCHARHRATLLSKKSTPTPAKIRFPRGEPG